MTTNPECLLGVDLGTGGCKLTLVDTLGAIICSSFTEYRTYYPRHGWSEQNPEDWYQTFLVTLARLLRETGINGSDIIALAVDGSTHNAVLTGKQGTILRPCIMWTDQRSVEQVRDLEKRRGPEIFRITYNKVNPTWTLPQLLWLRQNEPAVMDRVERIFFTKDYLRYRFTGTWGTDHIDAQGSLLFDGGTRQWSAELIAELKLPLSAFPPIVSPTEIAGKLTAQAARESGLREGIPIVVGTSDTAVENYSAGAISPGQGIVKLATAGNVCIMVDRPHPIPRGFNYPHGVDEMWYIMAATNSCASANRWTRDTLGRWEVEASALSGKTAFQLMDEEAGQVPVGSDGLFFHPYLLGERAPYFDPYLRASFVGATMSHKKAHFYRAVLEGIAYSLFDAMQALAEVGLPFTDLRIIGGGAKSPLWRRIVADVMGMPVMVPKAGDSSFGAALVAGVGIGLFPDVRTAVEKCVRFEETITPDRENQERYSRYFALYQEIHDALAPVEERIHKTFVKGN
ncbi:MAG: xylulokinase [Syntrophales bacterium]